MLTCDYAYTGYAPCSESYPADGSMGLVASDCDWNGDGVIDCSASDEGGLACTFTDSGYTCTYAYAAGGAFTRESCTGPDDEWTCVPAGDGFHCTETAGELVCEYDYDASFELKSSSCERR